MIVKGTKQLGSFKRGINLYVPKKTISNSPVEPILPDHYQVTNMLPFYRSATFEIYKRTGPYNTITRAEFDLIPGNPSAYCDSYDTATFPDASTENDNKFSFYYYGYGCADNSAEPAPGIFYYSNANSRWTFWAANYNEVFYANVSDTTPPTNNYTSIYEPSQSASITVIPI